MCKIEGITVKIRKIDFSHQGKMGLHLEDGRQLFVPLSMFPDIKRLTKEEQKKWRVLDDIYFDFDIPTLSKVFSVEEAMCL
ncbi:MAG: DUF2442 domain-containing protein [Bacteroidales bacterium]|nr:DUF2442 domain-containing protein [Bacteroidales bacterium]